MLFGVMKKSNSGTYFHEVIIDEARENRNPICLIIRKSDMQLYGDLKLADRLLTEIFSNSSKVVSFNNVYTLWLMLSLTIAFDCIE